MKYRKKPIVIEAEQFDGSIISANSICEKFGGYPKIYFKNEFEGTEKIVWSGEIWIETLEGKMTAKKDDWIIRGIKSEIYPCKPDIFEKTYGKVE